MKKIILLFVVIFLINSLFSQVSYPKTLSAYRIDDKIKFDGQLTEKEWSKAQHIINFTQRELNYGQPSTERTEVAVLYNKNNLYFGIWCYQKQPDKIIAKFMSPDFDFDADDNFKIMLSPFDDNRRGYLFVINPNGARADLLISGPEDASMEWNGVWDVRTSVTDSGWFAEVIIPFNTLQFKRKEKQEWALNFERDIKYLNEEVLWQGWSRDYSILAVVKAGKLTGLQNIAYAKKFELKPYALAGWQYDADGGKTYPLKAGADLNIYLLPTIKLSLTTYTDFAQVEADRIPVNLSRFSVYYPEKRQFFLEGADFFSFYLGERNTAFYSRNIGISSLQQVPIIAGARLFGKIGRSNIGFLNIQEGASGDLPATNNTVFRYKFDIGKQSSVGVFFSNVADKNHSNQVVGIDATYQTSEFLKDKNLSVSVRTATSLQNFSQQDSALTWRLGIDYPNDLIDNYMGVGVMQKGFNPELGYIRRSDYWAYNWYFRIFPRWFTKYGIKRLLLKPWGFTVYRTYSTGELESIYNETRPFGAVFKSGERFELNYILNFDRIDEPFYLTDNVYVPSGKYWMQKYEIQFETYHARKIWCGILYNWGDFYGGKIKTFEFETGWNAGKHFNLNGQYSWNFVELPQGSVVTNELALSLNYAFTTRLNLSLFAQYNSLDNIMFYNLRLHWIPKIGQDFYLVFNTGYDEPLHSIEVLKPQTTSAVTKFVYRIMF